MKCIFSSICKKKCLLDKDVFPIIRIWRLWQLLYLQLIFIFYPEKYEEHIHIIFLFDSLIERDVPFIIAQVFIHPIIVCHHNFLKSFWRIFHLYSYVPLYICNMMITKILFYLAYSMSLLFWGRCIVFIQSNRTCNSSCILNWNSLKIYNIWQMIQTFEVW